MDNVKDMVSKGRAKVTRGEDMPTHKLFVHEVISIITATDSYRDIAKRFNISSNHVGAIKRRECWTHIKIPNFKNDSSLDAEADTSH